MTDRNGRRTPASDALLLAVAMVWGGSYLSAKNLVAAVDAEVALALRYAIAAIGMVAFVAIRRSGPAGRRAALAAPDPERRILFVGASLGVSQACVLWLETTGVGLTSSTNAGLLISLSLIFTPLLEMLVLRRRLPPAFYLLALVAITGALPLASPGGLRTPGPGDALVLTAAVVRAGHVTATARLLRPTDDVALIVTLQMVTGAAIAAILAGPRLPLAWGTMGPAAWGDAIYLGLACSVFAFLVQAWAVGRTSAARASLLMGTEPVWAIAAGVTLGGDRLGLVQILGAVLVVAATTLGARVERRAREARNASPPRSPGAPRHARPRSPHARTP
ncbi:MAG: DMT family transporter [Propioniciclava sp.]|uniref:DMT family transporter n=1 Tax=Propioniciclava sp. TaxID=2038686 RepID=UPI0039E519E4